MFWWLVALGAVLMGLGLLVRLWPIPAERLEGHPGPYEPGWHQMEGGVKLVLPAAPKDAEARLKKVALEDSRTVSPAPGAYVTRSAVWQFPDVTRVWRDEAGALHIHAHLVIGKGDLGVNRKRLERWLAEAGIEAGAGTS
ncbi:DUF1499 domain-containing protein [Oceanicola sp. D3]|uniref:DUF1499 domain-containing protein n=1 Tax=Oceanicola sp. D3 TaxID=2587163 RepID=UPI001120F616|nr:DUF1499 domain-containing protein [Oceanicola sp. D3]QDC09370.1 DUF1499 domain-containing protein [Oceanicola sp. D3]